MEKPKHQAPEEVVSGSFAKHLLQPEPRRAEQERRKGGAEQRQGRTLASSQCPQCASAPGNHLMSSSLAQQPGQKVPGSKSREGARAGWLERSMAQCAPSGERPRVREPDEEAWSGPVLQLPLGLAGIPEAPACPRSQGIGVGVFSPKPGPLASRLL